MWTTTHVGLERVARKSGGSGECEARHRVDLPAALTSQKRCVMGPVSSCIFGADLTPPEDDLELRPTTGPSSPLLQSRGRRVLLGRRGETRVHMQDIWSSSFQALERSSTTHPSRTTADPFSSHRTRKAAGMRSVSSRSSSRRSPSPDVAGHAR